VDESPTSHNVKERVFGMLMNLLPAMQKMGMPPPPAEMIDYLPIPATFAEKWKQSVIQAHQNPQPDPRVALEMAKLQGQANVKREEMNLEAQLERERAQLQARVDVNRQRAEMQQNAINSQQEIEQDWRKALLDASVKIETANITAKAKVSDPATQDATTRLAGEL
jgi:hypothetical protein